MIITAPASKSYAQRAIACAALASGRSVVANVGSSEDVKAAISIVRSLGAKVEQIGDSLHINGGIGGAATIDVGESGLSTRLFAPVAALCGGEVTIVGRGSILKRPMTLISDAMAAFGVEVSTDNGFLPIVIKGKLIGGGVVAIDGSQSSQLLTGLLTALPLAENDTVIEVANLNSKPYIDVTLEVLRAFGVEVQNEGYKSFKITGRQSYKATSFAVEGDWSGASCMLVANAIFGGVELENLNYHSSQADMSILDAVSDAGDELKAITFDATQCPDLFPALVALAAHCNGVSQIKGTHRLEYKESNRALALKCEFEKLGIDVDISTPDIMKITGGKIKSGAKINTNGDHRIAMATAVAAIGVEIEFDDKSVVDKSYPQFWSDYNKILKR